MDKSTGSTATAERDESLAVNPLNIDYDRFTESDINDCSARANVNCCMRKFSGIAAIATILKATAIESNAQATVPLADGILAGLAEALVELAVDGGIQIEDVGLRFSAIEREAK